MNFYLPLTLFCVATSITPGPNNLMIMMSGINWGIKKSLPHFLGICFGFSLMVFLIGLGLGQIFVLYPRLHLIIKVLGSVYMLYLAAKIISASSNLSVNNKNNQPLTFIQAILFQWINPKAWVMGIGAISAFTTMAGGFYLQTIVISLIFLVVGGPCVACWLIGGAAISRYLTSPLHMRMFNYVLAALLVLSILMVVIK